MDDRNKWLFVLIMGACIFLGVAFYMDDVRAATPTVTPTPDYVQTKVGTYWLSNGARVDWWLDEPRGVLCESLYESASLACVPLQLTSYGLPAVEGP